MKAGDRIGESWEVADLSNTSESGAGGAEQRSVIANGPLAGKTLHDAAAIWGTRLLGGAKAAADGGFPVLVKFLDARENLSVQVHPSAAYAAAHPGAHLKAECWYVLDAAPGSVIYKGVKPGVTREVFARHIAAGTVVEYLVAVPAVVGEIHDLPSGTCHALGAGVLVAEFQTSSDTTFRVFDWGRSGRALHIAESLDCITWGPAPGAVRLKSASGAAPAMRNEFLGVRHVSLGNESETPASPEGACCVVMVLAGAGSLYCEEGLYSPLNLATGMTVVVPAAVAKDTQIAAGETGRIECLVATIL